MEKTDSPGRGRHISHMVSFSGFREIGHVMSFGSFREMEHVISLPALTRHEQEDGVSLRDAEDLMYCRAFMKRFP